MDQLREQYRKTPEVTLLQQMAELKGQLADSERRIETIKAEKSQVLLEKEKFRANVHKLVRDLYVVQQFLKKLSSRQTICQTIESM